MRHRNSEDSIIWQSSDATTVFYLTSAFALQFHKIEHSGLGLLDALVSKIIWTSIDGLPCRGYIVAVDSSQGAQSIIQREEVAMEKLIARWSYWLGIACLVIAVIWRIVNIFLSWHSSVAT